MHDDQLAQFQKLNHSFYDDFADSFSQTRSTAWEGWHSLTQHILGLTPVAAPLEVLDIGCGNGRFLSFLQEILQEAAISFTGVDRSQKLLTIAQEIPLRDRVFTRFFPFDLVELLEENAASDREKYFSRGFHMASAFGVFHHMPTTSARISLLQWMESTLLPGGLCIVTFWQFAHNHSLIARATDKGNNDYLLPWKDTKDARFAHHFTETEIDSLLKTVPQLRILETYSADGKSNLNKYVILKKEL